MGNTEITDDMLSLPDLDDYGLPEPDDVVTCATLHADATQTPRPQEEPLDATHMEVLDHALFGPALGDHFDNIYGHFGLQTRMPVVSPMDTTAPGVAAYCLNIVKTPLRRSLRQAAAASAPPEPSPAPPPATPPSDNLDDSGSDSDSPPEPVAPPSWAREPDTDSDVESNDSMEQMAGPARPLRPQHDRHVLAWQSLRSIRRRPQPPVGRPPAHLVPVLPTADPDELLRTGRRAAAPNAKWLQNLTRFGPPPPPTPLVGSAFDTADPATPVWLEHLQNEWIDPTVFLDL